jgi:FkbM family methyltransferase
MLAGSLAVKTAIKMRLASILYRALKSIRSFAGATDVARVKRNGLHWELDLREGIDLAIFAFGSFERETARVLKKLVTPGSIVLDIGANIGAHTLNLGRLVGPTGKVYAFEPTTYAFSKLKRNLALNPEISARVVAEQARLTYESKSDRSVEIYSSWKVVGEERRHPKHLGIAQSTGAAALLTLDDYCNNANLCGISFVKLDVDGFETEVLSGGIETLRRDLPTICMELAPYALEERGSSLTELLSVLGSLGYHLLSLKDLGGHSENAPFFSAQIADGSGVNVVAVPASRPRGTRK